MPIDLTTRAPELKKRHDGKAYSRLLSDYLWLNQATPAFQVVSEFTVITRRGLEITWYGFRSPSNKRLPEFHATELRAPTDGSNIIDLYDIGAVGGRFDVDLILTKSDGSAFSPAGRGLKENGVDVSTLPLRLRNGVYLAAWAEWDKARGVCKTPMTIDWPSLGLGAGEKVLLWVVSYRHAKGGSRANPWFPIPIVTAMAGGPVQDDDGSPGDGEPGGEGEGEEEEEGGDDGGEELRAQLLSRAWKWARSARHPAAKDAAEAVVSAEAARSDAPPAATAGSVTAAKS